MPDTTIPAKFKPGERVELLGEPGTFGTVIRVVNTFYGAPPEGQQFQVRYEVHVRGRLWHIVESDLCKIPLDLKAWAKGVISNKHDTLLRAGKRPAYSELGTALWLLRMLETREDAVDVLIALLDKHGYTAYKRAEK